jgi:hypothetical protein
LLDKSSCLPSSGFAAKAPGKVCEERFAEKQNEEKNMGSSLSGDLQLLAFLDQLVEVDGLTLESLQAGESFVCEHAGRITEPDQSNKLIRYAHTQHTACVSYAQKQSRERQEHTIGAADLIEEFRY